ncbi:MAG: hypothetical protein E7Z63_01155 [Thermoplasmata archaeon]|nr:hypothetical protein [Thermoplasmata archaeon]
MKNLWLVVPLIAIVFMGLSADSSDATGYETYSLTPNGAVVVTYEFDDRWDVYEDQSTLHLLSSNDMAVTGYLISSYSVDGQEITVRITDVCLPNGSYYLTHEAIDTEGRGEEEDVTIACINASGYAPISEYEHVYGDATVGASRLEVDPNGGSGNYVQYVSDGEKVIVPTTNTYSDTSLQPVLLGWVSLKDNSFYAPGSEYLMFGDDKLVAVWGFNDWLTGDHDDGHNFAYRKYFDGENATIHIKQSALYDETDPFGGWYYHWLEPATEANKSSLRLYADVTNLVSGTHHSDSFRIRSDTSSVTFDGIELVFNKLSTCNIDLVIPSTMAKGAYFIELSFENYPVGSAIGMYLIVSDDSDTRNPSVIHGVTFEDFYASGPYGTAIKLPGITDDSPRTQDGWTINKSASEHPVYPFGGCYTIQDSDITLQVHEITDSIIKNSASILAYDCNGGTYTASTYAIAQGTVLGGTFTLIGDNVSKPGYSLLGWNEYGDSTKPIYPVGGRIDADELYIPLKAVWGPESEGVAITLRDPLEDNTRIPITAYSGYDYIFPEFVHAYYTQNGWVTHDYDPVQNPVDDSQAIKVPIRVLGDVLTYYAAYKPAKPTYTVYYISGGSERADVSPPVDGIPVIEAKALGDLGFTSAQNATFVGWAYSSAKKTPDIRPGDSISFVPNGLDQSVTLYAVWSNDASRLNIWFVPGMPGVSGTPTTISVSPYQDTVTYSIPNKIPVCQGFKFVRWTSGGDTAMPSGMKSVTLSGNRTDVFWTAVWETESGATDGLYMLTFRSSVDGYNESFQIRQGGNQSPSKTPMKDCYAFLGWFDEDSKTWWSSSFKISKDTVFTAQYQQVFSIETEDTVLRITVNKNLASDNVTMDVDGKSEMYTGAIPPLDIGEYRSGTVKVTVVTADGTYEATSPYTLKESGGGDEEEKLSIPTPVLIGAGVVAIFGLFVVGRYYL